MWRSSTSFERGIGLLTTLPISVMVATQNVA
ncbi:hypothetical protein LINPERPRIM_LOCUS134 [Linum perenne]